MEVYKENPGVNRQLDGQQSKKRAGKDTEFTVGDQPWSLDRIEKSASRAKLDPDENCQAGM